MQKVLLPYRDLDDVKTNDLKSRTLYPEEKKKLDIAKNKMDSIYNTPKWKIFKSYGYFYGERKPVAGICATYNVSNAWLKAIEMFSEFDLMCDDVRHFDNAAYPGSFILAAHHFAVTSGRSYKWLASSIDSKNKKVLDDQYGLKKNYPSHWLMHKKNNGDVTVLENLLDFKKLLAGKKINLYTSDLGFDVSSDYNSQEIQHSRAHIGQCLAGLMILENGGNFIVKQYTIFESITASLILILSGCFKEFYICKPITSKQTNSELYLVGKNLIASKVHIAIELLKKKIVNWNIQPIIKINKEFEKDLSTVISIFSTQSKHLNDYYRFAVNGIHAKSNTVFMREKERAIITWYKTVPLKNICKNDLLNMKDAMHQAFRT